MGKESKIGWTDDTFNIVWGCEKVSPACDNCYANELDSRYHGLDAHWGKNPRMLMADRYWKQPLKWNREAEAAGKRRLVFCSSMADVFETNEQVESQRPKLWDLIRQTPNLRWLLLTKRASNVKRMLPKDLWNVPNIWLGTTVESEEYLWRADAICEVPMPVHFVSMEPLLGRIPAKLLLKRLRFDPSRRQGINWGIAGCESGNGARYTNPDWYRELRDLFGEWELPYYLKQAPRKQAGISVGPGSWTKLVVKARPEPDRLEGGVTEEPYLDNRQHRGFPDQMAA